MGLIVQKFGGSSVADAEKIRHVARIITDTYDKGNSVVAVVSAQGGTTDELIAKAAEINPEASQREMDMLLATGEQASCALCAMAVEVLKYPVISLTGRQAGIDSDDTHGNARIQSVNPQRILSELEHDRIVIVAGFQGETPKGDIATLGRGGSDTSAVALAAALNAQVCQIYTDVDGVYTTDPRLVPQAIQLDEITYDEMLILAHHGAKVLHDRSVALAKEKGVVLEVLSSFSGNPGTMVKSAIKHDNSRLVAGIAQEKAIFLSLSGIQNTDGVLSRIAALLAEKDISADLILKAAKPEEGATVCLGLKESQGEGVSQLLLEHSDSLGFHTLESNTYTRISIVGQELDRAPSISQRISQLLKNSNCSDPIMTFGQHRISLFVSEGDGIELLPLLHQMLFEETANQIPK